MTNVFLNRLDVLSHKFFGVNPFKDSRAIQNNYKIMHDIYTWLTSSNCLITFPAGNVSHIQIKTASIADPKWNKHIAHLARTTKASILPIHIDGKNSVWFYLLGPKLHALRYGKELLNKQDKSITVRISTVISPEKIATITSNQDLINYCRLKSDELLLNK